MLASIFVASDSLLIGCLSLSFLEVSTCWFTDHLHVSHAILITCHLSCNWMSLLFFAQVTVEVSLDFLPSQSLFLEMKFLKTINLCRLMWKLLACNNYMLGVILALLFYELMNPVGIYITVPTFAFCFSSLKRQFTYKYILSGSGLKKNFQMANSTFWP